LDWTHTQDKFRHFPFGLDFFMTLLDAYWQPLKLLSLVAPLPLFHLLESATRSCFGSVLDKLIAQLSREDNSSCNTLVKLNILDFSASFPSSSIQITSCTHNQVFSVLKWSLLSNGHIKGHHEGSISFEQADVEALVASHIPLNLLSRDKALETQLVPLILALDGPAGGIFFFFFCLLNVSLRLSRYHISASWPPPVLSFG
jgi:hypothetical protein